MRSDIILDLLKSRRSIRRYKDKKIEQDKIDTLIKSALLSPSSRGTCPWGFVVVDDRQIIMKLTESKKHNIKFLDGAPLAIIVYADPEKTNFWVEDTSIASTLIHLAAHKVGLGSCWIQIRNKMYDNTKSSGEYIKELVSLPEKYRVESIIAIGYPDESKAFYQESELKYNKVYKNKYGNNCY